MDVILEAGFGNGFWNHGVMELILELDYGSCFGTAGLWK